MHQARSDRREIGVEVGFGVVVAVLVGTAGLLTLRWLGSEMSEPLLFALVLYLLMGLTGSLWWWRGRGRYPMWALIGASLLGLWTVMIVLMGAEGVVLPVMALMYPQLPAAMVAMMFIGAKLGYRLRDGHAQRGRMRSGLPGGCAERG